MCTFFLENREDILVNCIGAFFGFGLIVLLEKYKIQYDNKKKTKDLNKEKSKKINDYKMLLEKIVKDSQEQINLIKENIKEQKNNLFSPVGLKRIQINVFIKSKNIDSLSVFEALADRFTSDKDLIKKYHELNACLDFLEGIFCEEIIRINKRTCEKAYNDQLCIKSLIEEIPDILSKEIIKLKMELGEIYFDNEEYNFINETIGKYLLLIDEKSDLSKFNTNFLEPIVKHSGTYMKKSYMIIIILKCKSARVKMNDIKNDIEDTVNYYQKIIDSVKEPIEKIKEMINLIND
jgi:hypothetical protein